MTLVFDAGRLAVDVIAPVMDLCNNYRLLAFILQFKVHNVAHSNGVSGGNIIKLKDAFDPGVPELSTLIFH